jgi:ABC-type amino acid transport substrate-binding protein
MTTVGYGDKAPRSKAGKVIALIWMFSGLLFISGLTASVASTLTINQLQSNPEGFVEYKSSPVGCIENSSTSEFLRTKFFNDIRSYENVTAGLDALMDREVDAFLYDEPILRYRIDQEEKFQHLRILPFEFDLQLYAFGLPDDQTELRDILSQKILEITESVEWQIVLNEYNLSEI